MFDCCRNAKRKRDEEQQAQGPEQELEARTRSGVASRAPSPTSFLSLRVTPSGALQSGFLQRCLNRLHLQQPVQGILHEEALKSQRPLEETQTDTFVLRNKESDCQAEQRSSREEESRGEESRAEQSRAVQSRAEGQALVLA